MLRSAPAADRRVSHPGQRTTLQYLNRNCGADPEMKRRKELGKTQAFSTLAAGCHTECRTSCAAPTTSSESAMLKFGHRQRSFACHRIQSRTAVRTGRSARPGPGFAGQAQPIVEIAQHAGHHAAEREREPGIAGGTKPEQPSGNRDQARRCSSAANSQTLPCPMPNSAPKLRLS